MNYLPIFFDITDKTCLVIGGGDVAFRKCQLLHKCRAKIKLIAVTVIPSLQDFLATNKHLIEEREYQSSDLAGCALVIAATNKPDINKKVYEDAKASSIPVNVVDDPALCSFIFPSIIDRHPVIIAISSGGNSPILARLLRARLETLIPENYGKLADLAGRFRDKVKNVFSSPHERRHFWGKTLQGPVAELVFSGRLSEAEENLELALSHPAPQSNQEGEVYLVGAGPGDADLLTFRALRLMQQADVVFYDNRVSQAVLNLVRKDARQVCVVEKTEDQINLLVDHARQGLKVLRLKSGDAFVSGQDCEEIREGLARQGIRFQVVPGIIDIL